MSIGISFKQFNSIAPHVIRSRKPIMGHGKHGIGKSELVYQLADKLVSILKLEEKYGSDYIFPVVERRASQMADTGDVIGVPEPETTEFGRVTKFAPMAWFAQACNQPCILFFDEVDRANTDVAQSIMELTDSRKIAGHTLHPDTVVIAMVNGGSYDEGNTYQVRELDPAEYDRWWHVNLEPTTEDWLEWAADKVHPMVKEFIKANDKHLEHKGECEPYKIYPSRRSWAHFDRCLREDEYSMLEQNSEGKICMDLYYVGEGFVGQEASIAFREFVEKYERQIKVEDVLAGNPVSDPSKLTVNEANNLVDKISDSPLFKAPAKLTDEEVENLSHFIAGISPELVMKAWELLCRSNGEVVAKMWKVTVKDMNGVEKQFGTYIADIIGGSDSTENKEK